MSFPIYELTVPVFIRGFSNLIHLLQQADQQARQRGYPVELLLQSRFYPDMYELSRQVRQSCEIAITAVATLLNQPKAVPELAKSNLQGHIGLLQQSSVLLSAYQPEQFVAAAIQPITLFDELGQRQYPDGSQYLLVEVLPNFYFHLTTCYNLLRHNGVAIGKKDFLGENYRLIQHDFQI